MKRSVVAAVGVAALVAACVLGWTRVHQEREFRRLIAAGDSALAGGRTFEAIEAFSGAIALKPRSMLPYLKRGDTYRRRREYASALRDLRQSESLDPTAVRPLEQLGDTYSGMGEHGRALESYKAYLTLDDRAPRLLYKVALAHYQGGDAVAAVDPLRRAMAIDDRLVEAHYLLGMCFRDRNRPGDALRAFRRAVALNPNFAAARAELARLYSSMGRAREEMAQLEALAAIEPADPGRLVGVALAHVRHGHLDAAIVTLERAAQRHRDAPSVHTALGRVWLLTSETNNDPVALRKAIDVLQPAATRSDATSEALTLLGRALFLSGHAAAAERALQQATTRLPVEPDAFRYLADAASRLGHAGIARAARAKQDALTDH